MTRQVAGLAERMDMHSVGDLTRHLQHPRIDRGDVDLGIGLVDRSGAPLPVEERQLVELAVVVERFTAEPGEARLDGADVVTQTWTGMFELDAVAPHHVRPDLGAESQPERTAGELLEFPRQLGGDHRAAGERHGDTGREFESRGRDRGRGGSRERRAAALGQQHPGEPGVHGGTGRAEPISRNGFGTDMTSTRIART